MLEQAQGGRFFAAIAASLDLDESQTRKAMGKLCPVIAERLHQRAGEDENLFQSLLDLIADNAGGSLLEDKDAMVGPEAIADGNAILEDVFGSRTDAMASLRAADETIPERELSKLAPISATAVVAALAQSNKPMGLAAAAQQQSAGSGFFGALISAIIAGIVTALSRKLSASTRRRRTTGYARSRSGRRSPASRSRTTRSRKTANVSVEDVFRDILGKLGK